jgi:hypothetical protein
MKIQIEAEIFDDPDFCEDGEHICRQLDEVWEACLLFSKNHRSAKLKQYHWFEYFIKCDQCKEAWKSAKENSKDIFIEDSKPSKPKDPVIRPINPKI